MQSDTCLATSRIGCLLDNLNHLTWGQRGPVRGQRNPQRVPGGQPQVDDFMAEKSFEKGKSF